MSHESPMTAPTGNRYKKRVYSASVPVSNDLYTDSAQYSVYYRLASFDLEMSMPMNGGLAHCCIKLPVVALRRGPCLLGSHGVTCHLRVLYPNALNHNWQGNLQPKSSSVLPDALHLTPAPT